MKIVFYIPSLERGGVERTIVNLSTVLSDQAHDIEIIAVRYDQVLIDQLQDGIKFTTVGDSSISKMVHRIVRPLSHRLASSMVSMPGLIAFMRRERPDAIIAFQSGVVAIAAIKLTRTRGKVIVREASSPSTALAEKGLFARTAVKTAKRIAYRMADAIVANSTESADDLAEVLGVPKEKVKTIYNPAYSDSLTVNSKSQISHPWFQDDALPIVITVSRFSPEKGLDVLIAAAAKASQQVNFRLVILGDGGERPALEDLVSELGIEGMIDMPGYQSNPYPFIAKSDLFVLPSRREGLPNALIEALALGVPAVSTRCKSGPREILLEGDGGYLVDVDDVEAMASAIVTSLTDRTTALERLEAARQHLGRFRPEMASVAWQEVIE
ncbi:glycosyltransferase [Candidatus Lucifugimonas marina]|uniref:Glycosyltransferase n=1 Tax=Candidatus Lucifugimonas marina TaxID=3038979 RepID=A0AAJ6CU49_9CHLR|nr:glycosyltransferase [SAR202 cluster bacterium JH702]MDG0868259.1 glycosyltransferase [SAR202 cluster bacterium JH639]WFG34903.1 glycosyltransferase [SAR202 cluster bacterium JH545]WFG38854.1 glycosyltransferase [SAR202 cluster bacterium JH1073]